MMKVESTVNGSLAKTTPVWAMRRINEAGLALIKEFEGFQSVAYMCSRGIWTVGYGHTRNAKRGMTVTLALAERLLDEDLRDAEKCVVRFVQVPLSDNQFSALVCFVFNVGSAHFTKSSLLKLLNRGWYEQVPPQLARWNKAGQLVLGGLARRRAAEARLWNTPDTFDSFPQTVGEA